MRWVSYTRSISSRIGEENPANTIAEQNANIEQYLKNKGYRISEKYSDRKRSAEAADGFDRMVQDGMTQKFDAVAVDSIFRFGKTLPFAIEVLQKTFYPVGIQFAVVEDDFCSTDRTADEVEQYFKEKAIEKIRFEFIANRPYIESTEIFDAIRSSLKTAQEQARYIGRLLESDKDEVKRCQNIVLQPYREQARTLMDALSEKDVERTAVYRKYERCEMEQEQLEDFESRYQAEIEELEAEFKNIMMKVSVIEKAFSYVNPWLTKFQDLTTPEILERTHIKKYVERVWIDDFKRVEVVLKEEEWTRFFPEEWMRTRKEN